MLDDALLCGRQTKKKWIVGLLLLAAMMIGGALLVLHMPELKALWVSYRLRGRTLEKLMIPAGASCEAVLLEDRICLTGEGEVTVLEPDGTLVYQFSAGEENLSLAGGGSVAAFYDYGENTVTVLNDAGTVSLSAQGPVLRGAVGDSGLLALQVRRSGCLSDTVLMDSGLDVTGEIMLTDAVMALMTPGREAGLYCACVGTNGRWDIRFYGQDGGLRFQTPVSLPVLELIPCGEDILARTEQSLLRLNRQGDMVWQLSCGQDALVSGNGLGETAVLEPGEGLLRLLDADGTEILSRRFSREISDLKLTDELLILLSDTGAELYTRTAKRIRSIPEECPKRLLVSDEYLFLVSEAGLQGLKLKETVPGL